MVEAPVVKGRRASLLLLQANLDSKRQIDPAENNAPVAKVPVARRTSLVQMMNPEAQQVNKPLIFLFVI